MSGNPNAIGRLRPLSIGNVVSAGARLYRSHFKTYLKLALFAYLWLLIPIYGWAKYFAISGLIARLAFGELTNHPESVKTARQQVNRRLWSFLRLAVLIGWLFIGVYLGLPEKIRLGHLLAETLVISFHFQVLCLGKCKVKSAETSKTR